jgi:hypothetical protein
MCLDGITRGYRTGIYSFVYSFFLYGKELRNCSRSKVTDGLSDTAKSRVNEAKYLFAINYNYFSVVRRPHYIFDKKVSVPVHISILL